MAIPEHDVLKPKDHRIKDSDDWPSYTLKRTNILSQTTGELCSLFAANTDHPVNVFGRLEPVDPAYTRNIKCDKYRSKQIELRNITNYAFAEYEDGTYGFWAAGGAGWFELRDPVPAFKPEFQGMHEAASMFYMLADKVRRAHKTNPKLTAKGLERYANTIFRDYQLHGNNYFQRADLDDVREGFHEHREYIITCMLEAQEGLEWENSAIFNYFKHKFPDTIDEVQARMARNKHHRKHDVTRSIRDTSSKPNRATSVVGARGRPTAKKPASRQASNLGQETIEILDSSHSTSDASDDGVPATPSPIPSPENGSHKRKSILQPKGSKYSKKGMQRRGTSPIAEECASGNSSVEEIEDTASPLATVTARNTTVLTNRTLAHTQQHSSAIDKYASQHTYLPPAIKKKVLVRYPLPSTRPQGPGDIWTCTFDGCLKRIHAASTEDGRIEMQEHFREHTASAEEKIQLAMTESRPYLPVNNLVAHLQTYQDNEPSEATKSGTASGKLFPMPIKRSGFFN